MAYKKLAPGEVYRVREIVRSVIDEQRAGKPPDELEMIARVLLGQDAELGILEVILAEAAAYDAEIKRLTDKAAKEQAARVREAQKRGIARAREDFKVVGFVSEEADTFAEQDRILLTKLHALGHDPKNLPPRKKGKASPVKTDVFKALPWSAPTCNRCWKRLLKRGEIAYRSPP